ncbi:MAG TPA: alkaline phosphatase family protein [Vicinamibacterales bacterium]|nr:alkaline phosphatase family protein [Vicinamibacterales bacterium]
MTNEPRDTRVDELRQQLRTLGYLDAGVDRFVLGPARRSRTPIALAGLASVRVGILAGILLGPAAAIGLDARLPGLVTGARDAAVLALYLGALFGAATTVVSLAVCLTARLLVGPSTVRARPGRARTIAVGAGALVSAASLAYLTLWWRTANTGWHAAGPTALALVLAVAISLLLGHAVRIATSGVLAAGASQGAIARGREPSWRGTMAAAALAFVAAAVLLVWTAPADAAADAAPPLTVVSTGLRVRVVAIDGVDEHVLQQLTGAGQLPAFTALLRGARAHLAAADTRDPARAWTTIATGEPPAVHGVTALETRRVAGVQGRIAGGAGTAGDLVRAATDLLRLTRPAIVRRDERRVKTLWEVAAGAGLRAAVVNWWASWPAPATGGVVLTDRAILRLERGGPLDAEIAPAALYDPLRRRWPALRAEAVARAARAFDAIADGPTAAVLKRSAELDATLAAVNAALPGPPADLDALYLPGLDIAQHALLGGSGEAALAPSALAARLDALRAYYAFLDGLLAPAFTPHEGELVVVVMEPGRVDTPGRGLLAIAGPAVVVATSVQAQAVDVAPTVVYALGVPVSRELTGHVLTSLFDPAFTQRYPERFVARYGRPSAHSEPRRGHPLDQEMLDRLKSLGYVR